MPVCACTHMRVYLTVYIHVCHLIFLHVYKPAPPPPTVFTQTASTPSFSWIFHLKKLSLLLTLLHSSTKTNNHNTNKVTTHVFQCCPGWCRTDIGGDRAPKSAAQGKSAPHLCFTFRCSYLRQRLQNTKEMHVSIQVQTKKIRQTCAVVIIMQISVCFVARVVTPVYQVSLCRQKDLTHLHTCYFDADVYALLQ